MSNINFSLTEQFIIDPVLILRAKPLNTTENPLSFLSKVNHFFQSEVVTRIISIATSFFAAIDCIIHLTTSVVKSTHLALRKIGFRWLSPAPNRKEIAYHLKQSIKFLGITIIGSSIAIICPCVLKYFIAGPFSEGEGGSTSSDWKSTSDMVQCLWTQTANQCKFDKLWNNASIDDRRTFVHLLDKDSTTKANTAKLQRITSIYKKFSQGSISQWPSQKGKATFYHATSRKGLEGILKSGKIEVRHEKAYRGAFVSTIPETGFGKYILVFNRNIERLSSLNHGFRAGNAYWAGFSRDIPVNAITLRNILINKPNFDEQSTIKEKCRSWSRRNVIIKTFSSNIFINGNKEIPKEWFKNDPNASAIQNTIKIRVQQCQEKVIIAQHATKQRCQMMMV